MMVIILHLIIGKEYQVVIAFSGKSKAGKTTAANYLQVNFGFIKVSFADKLKELSQQFYPFTTVEVYGELKDKQYKNFDWTPRDFLIRLGHFARYHDKDFFVKSLMDKIDRRSNYVIDDLRFNNEANALKEINATLIRIERYKKYLNNIIDSSETELDDFKDFHYRINEAENLNIKSLHTKIDLIMDELGYSKRA